MLTKKELQAKAAAKHAEVKSLMGSWDDAQGAMPTDLAGRIDGLLGEIDEIMAQVHLAERIEKGEAFLNESAGTQAAHLDWRRAGPTEGLAAVDPQSWHEMEIKGFGFDPQLGMVVPTSKTVRYWLPEAVQKAGYAGAFEAMLRKRSFADIGPDDRKLLSEGVDSAGGHLVPPDFHMELIRKIATMTTVRPNARTVQTSRDVAQWPKLKYTDDDKYTSPVRLTWTGETPASSTVHRANDPVIGMYNIPVHTAMASLLLTNSLLEDAAFDVYGLASDLLAEAFSLGENDAFWNGDGVSKPMGILTQVDTADGPASVKSGTASTLLADGILDVYGAVPSQYERGSKWYMAKATEMVIRKMKDADNNYLWPTWPQQGNFAPAPRTLLDFPVVRDEFLPAVAAGKYPIVFGDLSGYLVLDRVGFSVQRLSELYAETDITLLLARKRVGGQLIQPWRVKVQKVSA